MVVRIILAVILAVILAYQTATARFQKRRILLSLQQLLKRIGGKGLKAYLTVDNALCFTKYDGFDPEASYESNPSHRHYGVDFGLSPTMRTFLVGAQFKF